MSGLKPEERAREWIDRMPVGRSSIVTNIRPA